MKKIIVDYLKTFITNWLNKDKIIFKHMNKTIQDEFDVYVLATQYLLEYDEKAIDLKTQKFVNSEFFENDFPFKKIYPHTKEHKELIEQFGENLGYCPQLLKSYYNDVYISREENAILNNETQEIIKYNTFKTDVETRACTYEEYQNKAKWYELTFYQEMPNNNYKYCLMVNQNVDIYKQFLQNETELEKNIKKESNKFKKVYQMVSDNFFVEQKALESGIYDLLPQIYPLQKGVFIRNVNTKKEWQYYSKVDFESINLLLNIRDNLSAHNHFYSFTFEKFTNYRGYILFLAQKQLAIFIPKGIFLGMMQYLTFANEINIDKYSFVLPPKRTDQATENNIEEYINKCLYITLTFRQPYEHNLIETYFSEIQTELYKLYTKNVDTKALAKSLKHILKERYELKIDSVEIAPIRLKEHVVNLFKQKIKEKQIKSLEYVGLGLDELIKACDDGVLWAKSDLKFGTIEPNTSSLANIVRIIQHIWDEPENLKQLAAKNIFLKDFITIAIITLLVYVNMTSTHISDELKNNNTNLINAFAQDKKELLQKIMDYDQNPQKYGQNPNKQLFAISYEGQGVRVPKQLEDYAEVLFIIRNGVSHNNIAIKYSQKSSNILDASIYFRSKLNPKKKVVCDIGRLLHLLTSDIFINYDLHSQIVAQNVDDLKQQIDDLGKELYKKEQNKKLSH